MISSRDEFMLVSKIGEVVFRPTNWVDKKHDDPNMEVCSDEWCGQSWMAPPRLLYNPDNWPSYTNHLTPRSDERNRPASLGDAYGGMTKCIYSESYEGVFNNYCLRMPLSTDGFHGDGRRHEFSTPYVNLCEGEVRQAELYELSEWKRLNKPLCIERPAILIHSKVVLAHIDNATGKVLVIRLKHKAADYK